MAKITAPNRSRFLKAKRLRRTKVAKLRELYAKASGAKKDDILAKALRVNKYLTKDAFVSQVGK